METRMFLVLLQRNNGTHQYALPKEAGETIKQSCVGCNNFLSATKLPMARTDDYLHVVLTGSHLFRAERCILKETERKSTSYTLTGLLSSSEKPRNSIGDANEFLVVHCSSLCPHLFLCKRGRCRRAEDGDNTRIVSREGAGWKAWRSAPQLREC